MTPPVTRVVVCAVLTARLTFVAVLPMVPPPVLGRHHWRDVDQRPAADLAPPSFKNCSFGSSPRSAISLTSPYFCLILVATSMMWSPTCDMMFAASSYGSTHSGAMLFCSTSASARRRNASAIPRNSSAACSASAIDCSHVSGGFDAHWFICSATPSSPAMPDLQFLLRSLPVSRTLPFHGPFMTLLLPLARCRPGRLLFSLSIWFCRSMSR